MSGPKTSSIDLVAEALIAAAQAAALERAEQLRREEEAREAEKRRQEQLIKANHDANRAMQRLQALMEAFDRFRQRYPGDSGSLPAISEPEPPDAQDLNSIRNFIAHVDMRRHDLGERLKRLEVESSLKAAAAALADLAISPPKTASEVLSAFLAQAARKVEGQPVSKTHEHALEVAKLSERLSRFAAEDLDMAARELLQQFAECESMERSDLLGSEIRLHVQQIMKRAEKQRADQETACRYLSELHLGDSSRHAALIEDLGEVISGDAELTQQMAKRAEVALSDIARERQNRLDAEQREAEQAQAAEILGSVLEDLGYEVEEVRHSLLAPGQIVHFRKPEWDENYFVRMRIGDIGDEANFNLIRSAPVGTPGGVTGKDVEMENAWCGDSSMGFNQIRTVAASRGLKMSVLRQIAPGQVPVQVVDPAKAPARVSKQRSAQRKKARVLRENTR